MIMLNQSDPFFKKTSPCFLNSVFEIMNYSNSIRDLTPDNGECFPQNCVLNRFACRQLFVRVGRQFGGAVGRRNPSHDDAVSDRN